MRLNRNRVRLLLLGCVALAYGAAIALIYSHRHLQIPEGTYEGAIGGRWRITSSPVSQIPEIFRSKQLQVSRSVSGPAEIRGDNGRTLRMVEGRDGYYFSESFRPSGAWILPGIARNWNEGRIYRTRDGLVVDGVMLEKGLTLFVIPFQDVASWQVELRSAGDASGRRDAGEGEG